MSQAHFDASTYIHVPNSIQLAVPFFDQFYQIGKTDRANGFTRSQAQQREAELWCPDCAAISVKKSIIINRVYSSATSDKERKILADNAIAAYWDGYEGR